MENSINPNFQNPETRQRAFKIARAALAECAKAEASANPGKKDVEGAFTSHAERTVEVIGIFADGLVPELAYHAALLHDVADRAVDCEHDEDLRQAAAQILRNYFKSNHIDKTGRTYIESLLADTFYIERQARRQRQQFYGISRNYKFLGRQGRDLEDEERSCLSNGSTEVGGDLWRINPPATDVKYLLELSERVNVESVIIKAAEVIDHLRAHDVNETDAGLLRETLEAESLYAPLCEIWGLDAMAMTLRSLALKRRIKKMNEYGLLSNDEQDAIGRAQAAGDRVREFGGARQAIHRLFDERRCLECFSVKPTQNGETLAEMREDFVRLSGDDREIRIVSRTKTDGSRWSKGLRYVADGVPEAESMDDIGMTVIVESTEELSRVFGRIAGIVAAHAGAEFKAAPSKRQAMYIQGSKTYIDSVRGQLPDDWQIETKIGDYQVAKFTFVLDSVPVEIQFVTSEDRENARVGHTAHILYKMQQVGKEELSTEEITNQLKAIRSRKHKVSPNNKEVNVRTNDRRRLFGRILDILSLMITYYTDGSASPNPGPGGFAVIRDLQPWILGSEAGETTNIRMEGKALIAALKDADGAECIIYTDSEFWINVVTKWAPGWQARGWTKKGGEIKNLDIVQELFSLYQASQAELRWVRGHEGDEGNELADEWANRARTGERLTK